MLFHVTWEFMDQSEDGSKRSLSIFQNWKPAEGANFLGFYGLADNSGGVAIVDVDSHQTLAKITAPFTPWMRFEATPILPVEESAQIAGEALAWIGTVK